MKDRKAASICYALAIICWGALTFCGVCDGNVTSVILYGICLVFSTISLVMNIKELKNETYNDTHRNRKQA